MVKATSPERMISRCCGSFCYIDAHSIRNVLLRRIRGAETRVFTSATSAFLFFIGKANLPQRQAGFRRELLIGEFPRQPLGIRRRGNHGSVIRRERT